MFIEPDVEEDGADEDGNCSDFDFGSENGDESAKGDVSKPSVSPKINTKTEKSKKSGNTKMKRVGHFRCILLYDRMH